MPILISYGMLSTDKNELAGHLVKAQCMFCGKKYGSAEEAKRCEAQHINEILKKGV